MKKRRTPKEICWSSSRTSNNNPVSSFFFRSRPESTPAATVVKHFVTSHSLFCIRAIDRYLSPRDQLTQKHLFTVTQSFFFFSSTFVISHIESCQVNSLVNFYFFFVLFCEEEKNRFLFQASNPVTLFEYFHDVRYKLCAPLYSLVQ